MRVSGCWQGCPQLFEGMLSNTAAQTCRTPTYQSAALGWGGNVCAWSNRPGTQARRGQAISLEGTPMSVSSALPTCSKTRQPTGRWKYAKKNYSVASGGKKIVNVLIPFTKPQPKKVTYRIPERKWCCRLWLGLPSCGWELWPTRHPRE